jgi:hypothetical protein
MKIEYDNGYYTGDVDYNEEMHGYGTYVWHSGDKYVGNWLHGERHGNGKYTWPDGTWYEGEFQNGDLNGYGTKRYTDGTYTGKWIRDERNGQGTFRSNEGWSYEGQWKNDEMHGRGKYIFDDGSYYEGEFAYGYFCGKGTRTFTSGCKYIGEFRNDEICGHGTWYNSDGSTLEGEWSDSENAKNVIFKHGSNFDRGKLVNDEFISELEQWTTNGSSYCAAIHSNNNTVEHGSYHRNDRSSRGALNHIHFNDGSEVLIEDCGDKLKLTMKKNGVSRVEYTSKASHNPNYAELAKRLFGK